MLLPLLLRHEWRLLARGRTAPTVFLLLALTTAYGAWNGARAARERSDTVASVQAHDERLYGTIVAQLDDLERHGDPRPALSLAGTAWYLAQPEGAVAPAPHLDPRRAEAASSEWVGARHAVLPTPPFAALAVGQSDLFPSYTRVTIRTRPMLVHSDEIENPLNLLSGRFDLAFVLIFCWPVLSLPLLYNVLSEERDGGTLALVRSNPVPLRALLLIWLGIRGGLLALTTVLASLGTLAAIGALHGVGAASLALWVAAVVTTAVLWCGLAAAVNSTGWRSPANAMALMLCWVALAIVAPALLGEAVALAAPVPSRVELITTVRTASNLSSEDTAALLTTYYEVHPDVAPATASADLTALRGLAQQDDIDRRIAPVLTAYREAAAQRQRLADRWRWASPSLLIHDAVVELAGTTSGRSWRFAEQVDAYHAQWRRYFYPLVHARVSLVAEDYANAPRFRFEDEPEGTARARATWLLTAAGGISLVPLLLGLIRVGWE